MKRVLIRRLSRKSLVSLEKIEEYVKSIVGVKMELTHQFWYEDIKDEEAINQYIISGTLGYDWVAYEMPTDPLVCFRMGYKWPSKLIDHESIRFNRDDFIIERSETTKGGLMNDKKQTRDTKQSDYDYLMSVIEPFLRGAPNGKDGKDKHTD